MPTYPVSSGVPAETLPYAEWGIRFLGYLVDATIPVSVGFVASFVIEVLFTVLLAATNGSSAALIVLGVVIVALVVAGTWFNIWNLAYRRGKTGQTLGQQVLKIKTVDERTLQPIGFGRATGRYFAHILDSCIIGIPIGWFAPLWEEKKQTWADKITHAVVIRVGTPSALPPGVPGMYAA